MSVTHIYTTLRGAYMKAIMKLSLDTTLAYVDLIG